MPARGEMKDKTKPNKKGTKKKKKKKDRGEKWCLFAAEAGLDQFVCSFLYGYEDGE